ncbi:MAG: hypothetical protein NZ772_00970 [Cyanobacteria bacterium]|nr:hypothetical protein [Cyanobacteriota bacterium]MDW8199744.1 hypothetical protein [Cyanobacteriota bacterium SKYGB_h_bin112]
MKLTILYLYHKFLTFCAKHRSLVTGLAVVAVVTGLDVAFFYLAQSRAWTFVNTILQRVINSNQPIDIGFAPEVWLSVLSLTLGTLIIIISIAAQSIPKLIDLYIEDWISLIYVWFLIIAATHSVSIKFIYEAGYLRTSSVVLNLMVFLPIAVLFSLPYIFYILQSTQPSNVIRKIFHSQLRQISTLSQPYSRKLQRLHQYTSEMQSQLFKSLNQLDNMLEYIAFKDWKAQIIQDMGALVQEYVRVKRSIHPSFFKISDSIRDDISFRTMLGQLHEVERTNTFYEQKCFRLLGNTYIKLIADQEFDLASLCGLELTKVGATAIECDDDLLIWIVIIRFNTLLRFALKHGVKNNEARNLYNVIFHYRNFIANLVKANKVEAARQSFYYLRIYGTEIYRHGRISPSMYFIVDVFAAEMKEILILVHQHEWRLDIQYTLLNEMLQIDNPPDFTEGDLDRGQIFNNGVRILQIGLGLYYLRVNRIDFVQRIVADILDDLSVLGESAFRRSIDLACQRLRQAEKNFWEDTDRGNLNLYYTPDQDQIDNFREILYEQMQLHLLSRQSIVSTQLF